MLPPKLANIVTGIPGVTSFINDPLKNIYFVSFIKSETLGKSNKSNRQNNVPRYRIVKNQIPLTDTDINTFPENMF